MVFQLDSVEGRNWIYDLTKGDYAAGRNHKRCSKMDVIFRKIVMKN